MEFIKENIVLIIIVLAIIGFIYIVGEIFTEVRNFISKILPEEYKDLIKLIFLILFIIIMVIMGGFIGSKQSLLWMFLGGAIGAILAVSWIIEYFDKHQ